MTAVDRRVTAKVPSSEKYFYTGFFYLDVHASLKFLFFLKADRLVHYLFFFLVFFLCPTHADEISVICSDIIVTCLVSKVKLPRFGLANHHAGIDRSGQIRKRKSGTRQ